MWFYWDKRWQNNKRVYKEFFFKRCKRLSHLWKTAILMESFHSYFRQLVEASHPGFYALWRCSKVEQKRTNLQTKRKPTWRMIDGSAVQLMSMNETLLMTVQVAASSNATASTTVLTASCDVCLNAPCISTMGKCNFLSAVYWHTRRHQFSLSCMSRCNIFYCPVLQLDVQQLQILSQMPYVVMF